MMLPGTNSKSSPLVAPPCSNRAVPASEGGACRAAKAEKRAKKKAKAEAEAAEKKQSEDAVGIRPAQPSVQSMRRRRL